MLVLHTISRQECAEMRSEFFILANVNKTQCCARTPEEKQCGRIRKQYQSLNRLIAQRLPPVTGSFFSTIMGGWTSDKIVAQLGRICKSAATKSSELNNTNSHLNHVIRTASFPLWLCFVPLARTSSTPRFTQLCRNEKSTMLDAMFWNRISMNLIVAVSNGKKDIVFD